MSAASNESETAGDPSGDGGEEQTVSDDYDVETDDKLCIACERKRAGGKPYKHGHAPFCSKSIYYGLSGEQISNLKEERSNKLKDTKENVLRRMGLSAKDTELRFADISDSFPKVCDVPADLTAKHLSALVAANESNPAKAPRAVTVILRYLQMLAPNLKKGTNKVIQHEENVHKLEYFRGIFPRGSITFTVPKEDPTKQPNPDYRIAEGCKLMLVRWELQTKDDLKCPYCKKGNLVYKKVAFSRTSIKPIIDIEGKLTWAVGSFYRCSDCDINVHATDPELLRSLPSWMQDAYPVDYTWINKVKTFQIGRRLAGLIETIFIGEGYDGHFVSYFLRKLYDSRYRAEHQLLVEAHEMHGEEGPKKDDWSFEKWTGEFTFPLGDFLREAFDFSRQEEGGGSSGKKLPLYPASGARAPSLSPRYPSSPSKREIPRSGNVQSEPHTPRKRQARPEDFLGPPGGIPPPPSVPPHPPPGAIQNYPPVPQARPPGPAGMSPTALSPPVYHGHQWPPTYGPGPTFPMHYSPPQRGGYAISRPYGYGPSHYPKASHVARKRDLKPPPSAPKPSTSPLKGSPSGSKSSSAAATPKASPDREGKKT